MPDIQPGRMVTVRGTRLLYSLRNVDGVYSCTCQCWKRQTRHPDFRTCKHLIQYRGAEAEAVRIFPGGPDVPPAQTALLAPHWPKKKGQTPPPVVPSLWDRIGGDDPFGEVP